MHGVGIMNVTAVVDKYGGDFAVSCDAEKFQTVVAFRQIGESGSWDVVYIKE